LTVVDPNVATAAQIRDWSVAVREDIPRMTAHELSDLESTLIAVKHRLRKLGQDIAETERTRIRAVQRIGELLGPGLPGDYDRALLGNTNIGKNQQCLSQAERERRHQARLLARYPEVVDEALAQSKPSLNKAVNLCKRKRAADEAVNVAQQMAEAIVVDGEVVDEPAQWWWQLGDHLLYCGDSSDQEFIERARGAKLAFADPPYNAGKAEWDHGFTWRHDYLTEIADIAAVTPGISAIADFFGTTTMPYRWSIAAHISNGMTRGPLGFGNWIYVAIFSGLDSIHRSAQDHMTLTVDASTTHEAAHESRKPARLLIDLIQLFTDEGDLVVDPFLGSGTTLFAADSAVMRT
ncbi:MAG: DNA methyltransferase, partial [Gammaproteobacteria bacterium]